MDLKQKSFILLPHFPVRPGRQLHLGTIICLSKQTKRPDPEDVLNTDSRVAIPPTEIDSFPCKDWDSTHVESKSVLAGLWADLSLVTGLGVGGDIGKSKQQGLQVKCECMTIERFTPSKQYLEQSMTDASVQGYLEKLVRPSVYMITGMMIAEKAVIAAIDTRDKDWKGQFSTDGTQLGVPIKVGPKASIEASKQASVKFRSDDPFILAYRLRRFRRGWTGTVTGQDMNKWALLDDQGSSDIWSDFVDSLEFEDVDPDTTHNV